MEERCRFTHPSGLPCLVVEGIDLAVDGCEVCRSVCTCNDEKVGEPIPGFPACAVHRRGVH